MIRGDNILLGGIQKALEATSPTVPQDAIRPRGSTLLVRGVVIIGSCVELVGWLEVDFTLFKPAHSERAPHLRHEGTGGLRVGFGETVGVSFVTGIRSGLGSGSRRGQVMVTVWVRAMIWDRDGARVSVRVGVKMRVSVTVGVGVRVGVRLHSTHPANGAAPGCPRSCGAS